jgi:hypothetical protein
MLSSLVTKCLEKETALDIQTIVILLPEYYTASLSLKHKVHLHDTHKSSFYFAVTDQPRGLVVRVSDY